jgi:hypothetical protein
MEGRSASTKSFPQHCQISMTHKVTPDRLAFLSRFLSNPWNVTLQEIKDLVF